MATVAADHETRPQASEHDAVHRCRRRRTIASCSHVQGRNPNNPTPQSQTAHSRRCACGSAHHHDEVCDLPHRRAVEQNGIISRVNRAPDNQHATFATAKNTADKETDRSSVAPFSWRRSREPSTHPAMFAKVATELSFLVTRLLNLAELCTSPAVYSSSRYRQHYEPHTENMRSTPSWLTWRDWRELVRLARTLHSSEWRMEMWESRTRCGPSRLQSPWSWILSRR